MMSRTPHGVCDGSSDLDLRLSLISTALWGAISRRVKRGVTDVDFEVGGDVGAFDDVDVTSCCGDDIGDVVGVVTSASSSYIMTGLLSEQMVFVASLWSTM